MAKTITLIHGLLLGTALPALPTLAAQDAHQSSAADTPVLEEIVVSANKRGEGLQEVPLSVTAMSGDALRDKGAESFVDYARSVPALSFIDSGVGRQRVAIRGIDSKVGAPVVGYYLDETSLPASSSPSAEAVALDPHLADIDRIEVLRGPQGTVYGAGSMGGTIKIIPKAPDPTQFAAQLGTSGSTTRGPGDPMGFDVNGMVNIPLMTDRLALRVVGWYREQEGFIRRRVATPQSRVANRTSGSPLIFVNAGMAPDETSYGGRAALAFRPSDSVQIEASVVHQEQRFDGYQDITTGPTNPRDDLVQNFLLDIPESNINRFTLSNLKVTADLNFANLVFSASHVKRTLLLSQETTAALEAIGYRPAPFGGPIHEIGLDRNFNGELRLASADTAARFNWLAGVFYNSKRGTEAVDWLEPGFSDAFTPLVRDNIFTSRRLFTPSERAAFGEINYKLTEQLTATAGIRWYDTRTAHRFGLTGLFTDDRNNPNIPDPRGATPLRSQSKGAVKRFALNWQPSDTATLYAQAAEGFRAGSGTSPLPQVCDGDLALLGLSSAPTQVEPDTLWNYEVGTKIDWLDGRLRTNLAVYQIDWKDIQNSVFLPCGYPLRANIGEVRNRGAEIEVTAQVSSPLMVGFATGYVDSALQDDIFGIPDSRGKPLPDVPAWTASTFVDYLLPSFGSWDGHLRSDLSYTDGSLSAYTAGGPMTPDKGSLLLWDARLAWSQDNLEVAVFARNLLNNVEWTSLERDVSLNVPDRLRYTVNRPRTVGLELHWTF